MLSNKEIKKLNREKLQYAIGALMYCPANNPTIALNLIQKKININTIVFCLEDAILPQHVESATNVLEDTLRKLAAQPKEELDELPLIFIRVRTPAHLEKVFTRFYQYHEIIQGFVLPKYDTIHAEEYLAVIHKINAYKQFHYLPILESPEIMKGNRIGKMLEIKESLLTTEQNFLGVLVGSNDMCSYYKLRRNALQSVYDIGIVRDVLVDIIAIFRKHFVVNGPVWEFFDGPLWEKGLRNEIELDKINGFIGKACIHPLQVAVINEAMKVDKGEYADAMQLLNWGSEEGVKKSPWTGRMNEIATNKTWAEEIENIGSIYGTKNSIETAQ